MIRMFDLLMCVPACQYMCNVSCVRAVILLNILCTLHDMIIVIVLLLQYE